MSEALIRAQIKIILEGIPGIGVVHSYERLSLSPATYFDLMTSGGIVNGWTIHRENTDSERSAMGYIDRAHDFRIRAIYELNDAGASEITFQALLDEIFLTFKTKNTVNDTALRSDLVQIGPVNTDEFSERAYHTAELTLIVIERIPE